MMRDLESKVDVGITLNPSATTASRTGTGVDLRGYNAALAVFHVGAWTDGTHTPKLQESSDNTTFTDVGTGDLQGSFSAVSGTAGQNAVQRVGYIGTARYVRGFITVSGATTGALTAFTVARSDAARQPL